ncbi:histidine kinase dimerization/phosphoacceptor domain -containing protein [Methylobacterium sp. JK268]
MRLDALHPSEIDALTTGVILVDSEGTIRLYNRAESRFSGRTPDAVIGRNFFCDVAPCTRIPAFYGRFRDGVRRGDLAETFTFAYGFDPQPLHVRVTLTRSQAPDRYWIVTEPLARIAVSPQREAVRAAIDQRVRAEPIDPGACEREPIHVPGAIQPHAVLLAAAPGTLRVTACSANATEALDGSPLGRPLDAWLPAPVLDAVRALAREEDPDRTLRLALRLGPSEVPFDLTAHLFDGRLLLELERLPRHPEDFATASLPDVAAGLDRLRAAADLAGAAHVAAREVRRLTGFEAVLVYRFDPDWNGEAVAEDRDPAWNRSLLGLHFPASDIPAQARSLYTRAKSRFVIDRDYVPVPLLAIPDETRPVDLSLAQSRSLSPIHLEYQRNLGVNGSMSVSILVEGRLWGLMIGHHRKPHYVTPDTRAAAAVLTDAFALRIHELETGRRWREQQDHLAAESRLVRQLAGSDDVLTALTGGDTTLLAFFGATGAAIVSRHEVRRLGDAPPDAAILAIARHLRGTLPADRSSFASAEFPAEHPPTRPYTALASGVLAAFADPGREHLLLWFRPEVPSTVTWGGDPRKTVLAAAGTATVLPRRSFERWVEERRGASEPFASWQIGMAEALAQAVEGVVLRQQRKIAELTALLVEKEALLAQKDLLAKEIDHRVKNSLQIVSAFLHMQRRQVTDPAARQAFSETVGRVMSVARVHDSLYQTESVGEVDLGQTIETLCSDLSVMASGRHTLSLAAEPGLMVPYRKAVALSLIATELVTNAFKYAYDEGGRVSVSVGAASEGRVSLSVRDEGRGLPADWAEVPSQGTGLGMKLVRAMLDQINARIEVEPCLGACFKVTA